MRYCGISPCIAFTIWLSLKSGPGCTAEQVILAVQEGFAITSRQRSDAIVGKSILCVDREKPQEADAVVELAKK